MTRVATAIAREIVGWEAPMTSATASWEVLVRRYITVTRTAPRGPRILGTRAISSSCTTSSTRRLNSVLPSPVIPLVMTARS